VVGSAMPDSPASGGERELHEFLRDRVPDYMVPSTYILMDALPLTPNGKLDRRALPEPDLSRSDSEHTAVAPRTTVERELAAIWSELLGGGRIGLHDNFFALGGHSLLATQLISRIRNIFKIELPVRRLFEYPTLAGLAQAINESAGQDSQPAVPKLRRIPRAQRQEET